MKNETFKTLVARLYLGALFVLIFAGSRKMEFKGSSWHESCFVCQYCQQPLGTKPLITKDNENYCVPCFEKQFAHRCYSCKKVTAVEKWKHFSVLPCYFWLGPACPIAKVHQQRLFPQSIICRLKTTSANSYFYSHLEVWNLGIDFSQDVDCITQWTKKKISSEHVNS